MGEAKRRKLEIGKLKTREIEWLASLRDDEKVVAEVAKAAFEKIVMRHSLTGGCYNLAFFLREHMQRAHGIQVEMVVGWVNDGTWDGATSHAWIEFEGKKTDISLYRTEHPDAQPPGDVLIQDFLYKKGAATYTYWRNLPDSAREYLDLASRNPEFGPLYRHKDEEHKKIRALAASPRGAAEYFRNAPPAMRYESLAGMLAV